MKKIAFMGAHSSAKTTTVNRLGAFLMYLDIPHIIIPEMPRICPYEINQESGFKAQAWMVFEQIRRETQAEREIVHMEAEKKDRDKHITVSAANFGTQGVIICDRCIWDYMVYGLSLKQKGQITDEDFKVLKSMILSYNASMTPYDVIFFCEPKPLYEDGIRDVDPEWREEIYRLFKLIIKEYNLNVVQVQ